MLNIPELHLTIPAFSIPGWVLFLGFFVPYAKILGAKTEVPRQGQMQWQHGVSMQLSVIAVILGSIAYNWNDFAAFCMVVLMPGYLLATISAVVCAQTKPSASSRDVPP
jgi:hypothetical protein